jgi:hypothetical protein
MQVLSLWGTPVSRVPPGREGLLLWERLGLEPCSLTLSCPVAQRSKAYLSCNKIGKESEISLDSKSPISLQQLAGLPDSLKVAYGRGPNRPGSAFRWRNYSGMLG